MTTPEPLDGVLVVDKSRGPTSHDVVNVARRALGTRAIGHTGTLDPMATGVLVLVVGEATKLVNALTASTKRYTATLRLGVSTHTLDAEGEVDGTAAVPSLTLEDVQAAAQRFAGEIEQRVPNVSAIKVDGTSLYKKARRGQLVDAPTRRVRLDAIEVLAMRDTEIDLDLRCGSGFYVRSLARDLAHELGTLGHLTALRRVENGGYDVAQAVTFEALKAARNDEALRAALRARLVPLATVCRGMPHVTLDDEGVTHARCGRAVAMTHVRGELVEETMVAFDTAGIPVALVGSVGDALRVVRGFQAR